MDCIGEVFMIDRNELRKFIEPYYVDKDIMHNMWHIGQSGGGSVS